MPQLECPIVSFQRATSSATKTMSAKTATKSSSTTSQSFSRARGERQRRAQQLESIKEVNVAIESSSSISCLVYTAIKLTNYYTNILFNSQNPKSLSSPSKGESWRAQQLAYQIPHQDLELLAATATSTSSEKTKLEQRQEPSETPTSNTITATHNHGKSDPTTCDDEIEFIRGQRKLASQFKASLYYLSPTKDKQQVVGHASGGKKSPSRRLSLTTTTGSFVDDVGTENILDSRGAKNKQAIKSTSCFKVS